MSTNYYLVKNRPSRDSGLHIGKSSIGWRFLFRKYNNPFEIDKPLDTFERWRDYLKETTESGTHVIMDEYDNIVTYEFLIELIENKQQENSSDMFEYCENINGYRFEKSDFS